MPSVGLTQLNWVDSAFTKLGLTGSGSGRRVGFDGVHTLIDLVKSDLIWFKWARVVFHWFCKRGKLTKKRGRGANLQVILCSKKITGRSPLRFLEKCAGRNLISIPLMMRSIRQSDCRLMGFPSRLVRGIVEQKVGKALLLLLELPPLGNSF